MTVTIVPKQRNSPPELLADAEVIFGEAELSGLKLVGFSIWERSDRGRSVSLPARHFTVNGERRTFALLRSVAGTEATDRIKAAILKAFDEQQP